MERLSLDTSATISEGDLRVYEENLIKKVKAEEYEEALKIANKIVSAGKGNIMTKEIQKLLLEKIELENESSSEYSSSSSSSSSTPSGSDNENSSDESSEGDSDREELNESDTLWGKMGQESGAGAAEGRGTKEKRVPVLSKEERTVLKSKLMSELASLKQKK